MNRDVIKTTVLILLVIQVLGLMGETDIHAGWAWHHLLIPISTAMLLLLVSSIFKMGNTQNIDILGISNILLFSCLLVVSLLLGYYLDGNKSLKLAVYIGLYACLSLGTVLILLFGAHAAPTEHSEAARSPPDAQLSFF